MLGENQATFAATVTPFKNVPGTPGFVAQSVFDLGAGEGGSEPGLNPFAIAAGKFRNATNNPSGLPDLALVLPDGITVLNNGGEFKFTADAKCQGVSTSPATNCYLGNDPNFPGFPFSSPPRPAVIAADVNGDGIDDIVLAIPENCNSFDSGGAKARIYVLLSNGDGSFRPAVSYPSPVVNPVALALGNILGPGAPDLVVTNGGEVCTGSEAATGPILNMGAALLPNLRDGSAFGSPATLAAQPVFPQTSDVLFPQISAVAVADMNADGTADVVISASDGIHVLLNKKTNPATFKDMGPVPLYGPGDTIENAAQIDIADFNGDRTPDVAAAIGGIVYVFTNDGTGFLTSPSQGFASGPNSGQVKAIDVNGDQVPDVLVSNSQGFSEVLNNAGVETPLAQFSALNLSYGGMALGTPSLMLLTLGNTGGAPLIISSFDYTKNTAGQFTTKQVQCGSTLNPTSPITIAIGGNCTFEIIFTPSVLGTTSAQIVFDDNASSTNAPQTSVGRLFQQTIELTGAGVVSTANVSIAVSNSPTVVTVGTPILEYTITLTNTGPSPATNLTFTHKLESSVLNQGVVSSQGNCTGTRASGVTITCSLGTLPANSSATIVLDVTPNAAGVLRNPFSFLQDEQDADVESTLDNVSVLASLNASVPAISEPITVNDQVTITQLINVAAPVVFFSPSSVGFGTVASDATAARVVTVSNIGVGSTGLALTKAAMSSSAFTLGPITCSNGASSLPTTLPSGGACTVTITLSGPAPSGATITFTDNAALSNVTSTASGSSFTQSIPLIGSSMSITLPPPPSTVAIPTIDEPIMVNDTVAIKVTSPPSSTVTIGSKLGSIILDPTAGVQQYIATVALSNGGNIAGNIQVISATLNGVSSTSVPISLTLGSADSASITLNFPSSAGTSGTLVVLSIKGTYSASEPGGISLNGSWTGEFRVTLPASTQ